MKNSFLEERIVKEESDKLARKRLVLMVKKRKPKLKLRKFSMRNQLSLRNFGMRKVAEKQANFSEDEYTRPQAYNMNLQQYNSSLQFQLETCNKALKRVETEKATIVESLSNVRGHYKAVQDELSSLKVSHNELIKQNEELKQIRDDHDCLLGQVHELTEKVAWHREYPGKICTQLDKLTIKTKALEKHLFAEKEKLKVCIFAYGQTGAGKTYTMMGRPDAPDLKGLIPRSLEQIFQTSQSLKDQGWKYTMHASILKIYNETIRNLLSSNWSSDHAQMENGASSKQHTIKHDANGNTCCTKQVSGKNTNE
ncbi:hypothetical protein VNO80_10933 [Phaseolus coccineus]|uniref:Kinesin motor domain-containing protein n=1 Tax=Phaseolus coccineus TaxID=3886 RepID=A0AAN9RAW9_PHACN